MTVDSGEIQPLRERIIELARRWDEESVEPAEDFADALLDLLSPGALGLEHVGFLTPQGQYMPGVHRPAANWRPLWAATSGRGDEL